VFSLFSIYKVMVAERACMGKKIDVVTSEKLGIKRWFRITARSMRSRGTTGNGQVKTRIPNVTKLFIDKYLRANAKETTRVDRGMFSGNAWQ
jgi:hypothetical protein